MSKVNLTKGLKSLVDNQNYEDISQFKWCVSWNPKTKSYYARREIYLGGGAKNRRRKTELMHRRIMHLEKGDKRQVDHINHNTLDNRKQNLRIVTNRVNQSNRRDQSKYGVGITFDKRCVSRPFGARVYIDGKCHHLGMFTTARKARTARKKFLVQNK